MKKSCFFIGHRDSSWELYPLVKAEIINHIENYGVTEFIVGKYGAFDSICTSALSRIKQDYPHIKLYLLLPYLNQVSHDDIPTGFDGSIYPEGLENTPLRFAILKANKYAVDFCSYLIAHCHCNASNTAGLINYAKTRKSREIHITLI